MPRNEFDCEFTATARVPPGVGKSVFHISGMAAEVWDPVSPLQCEESLVISSGQQEVRPEPKGCCTRRVAGRVE